MKRQTKRQAQAQIRREEKEAVRMYLAGKSFRQIKKATTVNQWAVRGLVLAHTINQGR